MKLSSFLCWPHGKFILTEKVRKSTPEPLTNTKHKPIDDQDLRKTILYVMQKQKVTCYVIHVTQLCAGQYHLPQEVSPLLPPASCNPNSLPKFSLIALSINSGLTCCGGGGEYPSRGSGLGTSAVWPQDADTTLHTISCGIKLQASCSRWYSFKLHCILWSLRTKWSLGMLSVPLSGARGWPEVCSR